MTLRMRLVSGILTCCLICCSALSYAKMSVIENNGVWWLVDENGTPFYSRGVATVSGCTPSENKNSYYYGRYYPSLTDWRIATVKRLQHWGFNTLGGWSDADPSMDMPLTVELDLGRRTQLHWFDLFDPANDEMVIQAAREWTDSYKQYTKLIGFFSDNEVGWWNAPLFRWYLNNPWSNWTKRALFNLLFERYKGSFELLCKDFVPGERITSFEDIKKANATLRLRPGGQGIATVDAFTRLVAGRYYDLSWRALKNAAPDALVLGDRLPLYYNQDAVLASRGKLDILSSNYNVDTADGWVAPYYFEGLNSLSTAPVLVSEFFFAANENRSGNTNNGHLMHVATQMERASGAAKAIQAFAAFPNVVGAHWFQYWDEPTGGRGDGEDFNMGLVDIHDVPYDKLVAAMTEANAKTTQIHSASSQNSASKITNSIPYLQNPIAINDNRLTDWKEKQETRVMGWDTDAPYVPFGDVHLGWRPEGIYFFHIGQSYVDFALAEDPEHFDARDCYQLEFTFMINGVKTKRVYSLVPQKHHLYPDRFEPVLYMSTEAGGNQPVLASEIGSVQLLEKPLPHITLEGFIPAADLVGSLGLTKLESNIKIICRIRVTSFFHEHSMRLRPQAGQTDVQSGQGESGRILMLSEPGS